MSNYAINNKGNYPDSIVELFEKDENGYAFLEERLANALDPWGNPYHLEKTSASDGTVTCRVWCYGSDGKPGGVDEAFDRSDEMVRNGKF